MTKVTQKATSMFDLKISQGITHIMTVICWMKKEMWPKNFDLRSRVREKEREGQDDEPKADKRSEEENLCEG